MFEVTQPTIQKFLNLKSKKELAEVLDIKYHILIYNLHVLKVELKYKEFQVNKKNGGVRTILAPSSGIKEIQKRLSKILLEIYQPKPCTHSYVKSLGIKTNAKKHLSKNAVINLDLKDFFPSINFGRVQGLFKSHPFNFDQNISTALAQICCFKSALPQGAPTSPIVSNFICRKLDNTLMKMSKQLKCNYTRYADDLTFSTNLSILPPELGTIEDNKFIISSYLREKIESNDFKVNELKVTYGKKNNRQQVTGIKVNKKLNVDRDYIKKIRAMMNAWKKYGILDASKEHFIKYLGFESLPDNSELLFEKKLVGMIGFVGHIKGKQDRVYHKLYDTIKRLSPDVKLSIILRQDQIETMPILFGEGKTDWKHLSAAHKSFMAHGMYNDLLFSYREYPDYFQINNTELLKMCETLAHGSALKNKHIFMFDRDVPSMFRNITDSHTVYKSWGNNVYSFVIPKPTHRNFDQVCIEHYYTDYEIKSNDEHGRRLFLSTEFDRATGNHLSEALVFLNKRRLNAPYPTIIEHSVFDKAGQNVALPKSIFASNVLSRKSGFDQFSFKEFELIFKIIKSIIDI